jgi:HAD superfamily hydrolase (TIGR01549 family)
MEKITTILIDVGWPIVDETEVQVFWYDNIKRLVEKSTGRIVTDADITKLENNAITCYAPSVFSYILWQLVKPDRELFYKIRQSFYSASYVQYYRIQPGVKELLQKLHGRFKLGIAANQPEQAYEFLEKEGILQYFDSAQVSDEIGFAKPDLRMFQKVLDNLGSKPEESLMVGDRPDNDIVPAKALGMKTVRLLAGMHKIQQIRTPIEEPDYTIDKITDLLDIPLISNNL